MSKRNLTTFYLGDELFAADILQIKEVIVDAKPYSVPLASPFVKGLLNLRGQIITVIDLRWRLNLGSQKDEQPGTCIVLKTDTQMESLLYSENWLEAIGSDPIALMVDRVGDVAVLESTDVHPAPGNLPEQTAPFVKGVAKINDRLVSILSLERLLSF